MRNTIYQWIFTMYMTALTCDACVRSIRGSAKYKVEKGDTLVMKPSLGSSCNMKTNCSFQDFRWYRGDEILFRGLYYPRTGTATPYVSERGMADYNLHLDGYHLIIKGVKPSDMGIYVFEGRFLSKKASVKMFLFIANVIVQTRPGEPYISVRGCMCEGKRITLTCESDGMNPPVKLAWYREGVPQKNASVWHSRYNHALVRSKLHIGPLNRADHGAMYRCEATNRHHHSTPAVKRFRLRVQHSAVWNPKSPTTIAGKLGNNATLLCDVSSYPPPYRIEWYFKGKRVRKSTKRSFRKKHRYLTISRLSDKDFGAYFCTAENSRGKSKFKMHLKQQKEILKTYEKNINEVLERKDSALNWS